MSRTVAYRKQTTDTPNPLARFAHKQRYKLSLGKAVEGVPHGGTVRLAEALAVADRTRSPFPKLPWWPNSQMFLTLEKRPDEVPGL